jgi:hypothetical protein
MSNRRLTIPILALALVPAACGGSGDKAATTTTVARAPAAKAPQIPPELLGTWSTTLRKGDIPPKFHLDNPFTVRITKSGGVDGAPAFTIADGSEALEGETSVPVFAGDTVTLKQEGCFTDGVGYRFHDNVYRYALSGDTLRFVVVRNACRDRFAERILTTRTFRRGS